MVWYPDCLLENEKDKGYMYIVILASFLGRTVLFGAVYASGIYYVAIQKELNTSKALAAWVGSILIACVSMASLLSSALHNRYGAKPTAILSALISSFGLICSVFATSILYLTLSYGVITGIGLGISLIPLIVTIADYSDKLTHIAQSVASSGSSFGTFVGPVLIERLISYYGWRGSLLISSAIVLHIGVFGMLLRPFNEDEEHPLTCTAGSSTLSLKVMNWSIFRDKGYLAACICNILVCFSNSLLLMHLSAYAQWDVGLSTQKSAMLLSLLGGMGIVARLIFGAAIASKKVSPYAIVALSGLVIGLNTLLLAYHIRSFTSLIVYCIITGVFISSNGGAVWPAILTDLLGQENLSNSVGFMNFVGAFGNLSGPPMAGWLFDKTGKYASSFLMAGVVSLCSCLLIVVSWSSSLRRREAKKHQKPTLLVVEYVTSL